MKKWFIDNWYVKQDLALVVYVPKELEIIPKIIYVNPSKAEIFSDRVIYIESRLDNLLKQSRNFIIEKDHIEEVKYYKTEVGPRYYIYEEVNYDIFINIEGRIVQYMTINTYKGLKRVNFLLKFKYEWPCLDISVPINLSLIIWSSSCFALMIKPKIKLVFEEVSYDKMNLESFTNLINEFIKTRFILEGINLNRGFVASTNILGADYPIINEMAEQLVGLEWFKLRPVSQVKVYQGICNMLMSQIFSQVIKALDFITHLDLGQSSIEQALFVDDLKSKLRVLKSWSFSMIDNSIKQHFKKRKALILGDIYAGFDTEYVPLEWGSNKLVSAQISICDGLKLKIPKMQEYKYEGVNTATGETYEKTLPMFKEDSMYESRLNDIIVEARGVLFPKYDAEMLNICNYFIKESSEIENIINSDDAYLFQFKRSSIKRILILPVAGEDLVINFDTLTDIITSYSDIEYKKGLLSKIFSNAGNKNSANLIEIEKVVDWSNNFIVEDNIINYELSNSENEAEKVKVKLINTPLDNVSFKTRIYLCAHYNAADLGMLEDWAEKSNRNIDILKKSYTSLSAPIMSLGQEVHIRDTLLLSSAAASSLEAVGKAYGLKKLTIPQAYIANMDYLLKDDPKLFKAYAMQDSLITLVHALFMNDFVFKLSDLKIPSTLGSISTKYLNRKWKADKYRGYQVDAEHLLGNSIEHTPKGISNLGIVGEGLNQFIGSFRGGRNECFKYGIDTEKQWYDYDLTSCYSTIMSMCGDPNYEEAENLDSLQASLLDNAKSPEEHEISSLRSGSLGDNAAEKNYFNKSDLEKEILKQYQNVKSFAAMPSEDDIEEDGSFTLESLEKELSLDESDDDESESTKIAALTPTLGTLMVEPDYSNASAITPGFWSSVIDKYDFVNSYSALRVSFYFPPSVLYPPIPEQVKLKNSIQTIYPSCGKSLITGLEFLSACNIVKLYGGAIKVLSGTYIPFKQGNEESPAYSPFFAVINDLQANRAKWKKLTGKKSAMERIYKDLGNMLYGKVVAGISNKEAYNARIKGLKLLSAGNLTNPIIGAWITGFVRALLAELLNIVSDLKGTICSVTTDGFVTDIPDLENKVLEYLKEHKIKNSFLHKYREARNKLSGNSEALEVKTTVRGLAQWTTRGQISMNHTDPALNNYEIPIAALTGFQKRGLMHDQVKKLVVNSLNTNNQILFMQTLLTGASENYKLGQNVSMLSSLRKYRTVFDTKRLIYVDKEKLLTTIPYLNTDQFKINRTLLDAFRQSVYSANFSRLFVKNITANNVIDDMLRVLLRVYAEEYNWNIPADIKFALIRKISSALDKLNIYSFKAEKLLDLMNTIEQIPGRIVNKIPVYRFSQAFLNIWLENDDYSDTLFRKVRNAFSNFILPELSAFELFLHYQLLTEKLIKSEDLNMKISNEILESEFILLTGNKAKISVHNKQFDQYITINGKTYLKT